MPSDVYPKLRVATVQAAPVFLDRDATIDKMEVFVKQAKANGVDLIVFPESFIPTYPVWCLIMAPIDQHKFFTRLFDNSVAVPSPAFRKIGEIARNNKIFLSVGVTEKASYSMGAMWNTNLLFDREGKLLNKHRKIVPTWAEKLVWSFGDGSTLKVSDTEIGKIGALICGENTNTLARYSMLAQGEQIHIATFPPCWPIKRTTSFGGGYNIAEINRTRAAAHAFEGKLFNIWSSGVLDEDAINQMSEGDPGIRSFLEGVAKPSSSIVGPDGEYVADPIIGDEGMVMADLDISIQISLKGVHDIVGSYQRFDIFQLSVNQAPSSISPVRFYNSQANSPVNTFDEAFCDDEDELTE